MPAGCVYGPLLALVTDMRGSRLTGWRHIANAMWGPPDDPQIYGALDIDAGALLAFIERARAHGEHVTATHLVGRAVARALEEVPDLNVRIRGTRSLPRPSIDVFFITAVSGGHDLSGIKVDRVDQRSVYEVARELGGRARRMKAGDDREFARSKNVLDHLPRPLLRAALRATAFATTTLQLELPPLGLHRSPFGSAMVTSVGMFGLPQGFAPLAWMYDVPLLVLVGEVAERPVVVDHHVVARPVLPITATIDHRYVDGWHVSRLMRAFRSYLEAPERFEPAPPADPRAR
jgi:pyruvate/2-oxoglutarate dehydrogenase complex dihydrolipoamide acyltransferase (E2) component